MRAAERGGARTIAPGRWVTVFNGARDAYQVPLALHERGMLEALVTDWYTPLDRAWARAAAALMPARLRRVATSRHAGGLPGERVAAGLASALRTYWWSRRAANDVDGWLGARAGRLAAARNAGILAYSYYARAAFAAAGPSTRRLIFQVHPHPRSLATLYAEEIERTPEARASLLGEFESAPESARFESLAGEALLADGCIAASSYTARTLREQGIDPDAIATLPYGVDLECYRPGPASPSSRFRVLFVGQMVQRKGLSYLLEAWRRLALPEAELILAGRGLMDEPLLQRYAGLAEIRNAVSPGELAMLYRSSHVFCMPSLAEGFGLVYLEALASGTPIIGTPNTGAPDIVTDGEQGFIVPIRDVDTLAARLRWCYDHPDRLVAMRAAARARAERFSWPAFRQSLADAVQRLASSPSQPVMRPVARSAALGAR